MRGPVAAHNVLLAAALWGLGCGGEQPAPVPPQVAPSAAPPVASEAPAEAGPRPTTLADLAWAADQTAVYYDGGRPALAVRVDSAGKPQLTAFDPPAGHSLLPGAQQQDVARSLLPLPAPGQGHDEQERTVARFALVAGSLRFLRPSRIRDTIDARVLEDGRIRVRVHREILDPGVETQEAEGLFDAAHGRYESMQWRLGGSLGTRWVELSLQGSDLPYATDREKGRKGYDAFLAGRSPDADLAAAIGSQGADTGVQRRFLARARPGDFWSAVAAAPSETRDAILSADTPPLCPQASDVEPKTMQRLLGRAKLVTLGPGLRACPDPRIARFLRPLAHVPRRPTPRDDDERRALEAWRAVRIADSLADAATALRKGRPSRWFLDSLARLAPLTRAIEERPRVAAVPALVDLMRAGHEPETCAAVLRALTLQDLGADAGRWDAYWAEHRDKPYVQWLIEGVQHGDSMEVRWLGYELLGGFPMRPESHEALVAALDDPAPLARIAAARGLARAGDDAGAAILVDALDDTEVVRVEAFDALASLSRQPLGYAPNLEERERQRAIGRWREWLSRRRGSP